MRWLFLFALVACGGKKDSGPTCEQVVDHMLEVTKTQLMGHESTNMGQQKKAMVAQCETRNMDSDMRTCLMGAATISDIAKCRGGKTDLVEKPRRPRPGGSAAPAGSGSSVPFVHPPTTTGSAGSGSNSGSGSAK